MLLLADDKAAYVLGGSELRTCDAKGAQLGPAREVGGSTHNKVTPHAKAGKSANVSFRAETSRKARRLEP